MRLRIIWTQLWNLRRGRKAEVDYTLRDLHNSSDDTQPHSIIIFIINSYSFKIFPLFWLVKTTPIIHHNQLLLTKFGKNFVILNQWRQNDVQSTAWLQVIEPLTEKTWGRGWVALLVRTKWRNCLGIFYSFHGEILFKTFQEQQEDNSTENISYLELFWKNNKTVIEFGFRRIWRILQFGLGG